MIFNHHASGDGFKLSGDHQLVEIDIYGVAGIFER